jgi:formate hydrogenlyase transcriptional activator
MVTSFFSTSQSSEDARSRDEAYLAEAQKLSHTGSWAYDPRIGKTTYWSEELFRIFGLDPLEGLPTEEAFWQRIHPDDRSSLKEAIQRALREKADFVVDYRILLPDGTLKHIHSATHVVVNSSGEVVERLGTAVDVTERVGAEEALRRSEEEFRHLFDTMPAIAFIAQPDGFTEFQSRGWLEYSGLSAEASMGHGWKVALHPDDLDACESKWRASQQPFEDERRLRNAKGEYRWFLARLVPLRDEHGKILKWYGIVTDIDDRRRAEDELKTALAQIQILKDQLFHENAALREEIDTASMFEDIIGHSATLQTVLARVTKVAPTDSTVLITGETGTGKELFARAIHKHSQRSARAFVAVNCASIPSALVASELFGHEKGAFTGAHQRRPGRFELANGGTIFLDEVCELLPEMQIALLRVLQEREFQRVGGTQTIRCDVRVVAATNRDLQAAVAAGTFRSDLFYRLNVVPLEIPPLRERKADIPTLVEFFIDRFARRAGKKIRTVDSHSLLWLQSYSWPGNIRELQNIVERSVILCDTEQFSIDAGWLSGEGAASTSTETTLPRRSGAQEKDRIKAALAESNGRVSGPAGAAELLGMPASTLESRIRALRINKFAFKKS